jgi:hypothetical protein
MRPSAERTSPVPLAGSNQADRKRQDLNDRECQPPTQPDGESDDLRGVVLIVNVDGRSLIRWFTARSLVERYLAADRNDDDVIGISIALFELEVSVHDTLADVRRAAAAARAQLALGCASSSGAA